MKLIVMVSNKYCHLTWALEIRRLKMAMELRNLFVFWHLCIISKIAMYLLQRKRCIFNGEDKKE